MSKIILMGVGVNGLTPRQAAELEDCVLIAGSSRHLKSVTALSAEKINITPLTGALTAVRQGLNRGDVGVLATGDPLFFGIGRRLLAEFGAAEVEVRPALSTLQEACARFKVPWDDAAVVSLHGRRPLHIAAELLRNSKTLVFTDRSNSPDFLASRIMAYLEAIDAGKAAGDWFVYVAEDLGTGGERLVTGTLPEIAGRSFAELNVMLLTGPGIEDDRGSFGLRESMIRHSRGLITKDEVRAVTIHKLSLPGRGVLWDLGAGSGSVALESARLQPELTVYAVEKKEEELENIKENIRRYGCFNIIPVPGTAPGVLEGLPDPDRVFVGGSGGRLAEVIKASAARLAAGGRLVVNGVRAETVEQAPQIMAEHGLSVELSRLEVQRDGQPFNPITVMTGSKERGH